MFPSLTDSFVSSLLPLGPAAVNSPFRSPLPSHIQLSIGAGLPLPLPHSGFAEAKVLFFYSPSPLFSPLRNETQFRPLSFLPPSLSICRRPPRPPLHRPFRACVPSLRPWQRPRPADAEDGGGDENGIASFFRAVSAGTNNPIRLSLRPLPFPLFSSSVGLFVVPDG